MFQLLLIRVDCTAAFVDAEVSFSGIVVIMSYFIITNSYHHYKFASKVHDRIKIVLST